MAGPPDDPDRYQLGHAVAAGSEGVLYRATRMVADRSIDVAVKMLHPGHHSTFDRWARRWEEQADLLRNLAAPGLVAVRDGFSGPLPHAAGSADPSTRSLYLVMDWVEGTPMWEWAAARPEATAEQLLAPLVSIAAALDLLHSGIVSKGTPLLHGDVKPGNILVTPQGTAVLVDLGSVRMFDSERMTGVSGTPGYVAPEVLRDGSWSAAADRYALGCVVVALLSGIEPPVGATSDDLRSLLAGSPRCDQRPELVDHLTSMLRPDPADRPTDTANWIAQLRSSSLVLTPGDQKLPPVAAGRAPLAVDPVAPRPPRRRRNLVFGGVAAAALVAGGVVFATRGGDAPTSTPREGWANRSYPAGTCGHDEAVTLRDGAFEASQGRSATLATPGIDLVDVVRGDLVGDSTLEVLVVLGCVGPAKHSTELQVWSDHGPGSTELVATGGRDRCLGKGDGCLKVDQIVPVASISDGRIATQLAFADPHDLPSGAEPDPSCCPTTRIDARLRVDGDVLVLESAALASNSGLMEPLPGGSRFWVAPTGLDENEQSVPLTGIHPVPGLVRAVIAGWEIPAGVPPEIVNRIRALSTRKPGPITYTTPTSIGDGLWFTTAGHADDPVADLLVIFYRPANGRILPPTE